MPMQLEGIDEEVSSNPLPQKVTEMSSWRGRKESGWDEEDEEDEEDEPEEAAVLTVDPSPIVSIVLQEKAL